MTAEELANLYSIDVEEVWEIIGDFGDLFPWLKVYEKQPKTCESWPREV